jgi:hypothetical protein
MTVHQLKTYQSHESINHHARQTRPQLVTVFFLQKQTSGSALGTYFKTHCRCPLMEEMCTGFVKRQSKLGSGKEHNKLLTAASPLPAVKLLHASTI